ncbi:MAG: zf-TFIIB domain-containing protein [Phycisphaerales bacterium JB037]
MLTPVPPTAQDPLVACPKDGTMMERLSTGMVEIDRCPRCGGVWLDGGELTAVLKISDDPKALVRSIDRGAAASDGSQAPSSKHQLDAVRCPRDGSEMIELRDAQQRHIEYEACRSCGGVFFDAGELSDLSDFTLRERVKAMLGR